MHEVYWLTNLNSQFTEIASKKPCWSVHEEIYNVTQDIASMKLSSSWIGKYFKILRDSLNMYYIWEITIFSKCSKADELYEHNWKHVGSDFVAIMQGQNMITARTGYLQSFPFPISSFSSSLEWGGRDQKSHS